MDLLNAFRPSLPPTVGYMKNREFEAMEQDSLLLKGTLAGFADESKILIDLLDPRWGEKYVSIVVEAKYGKVKTVVIPDFSHLGFDDCWESIIMDVAELSAFGVRLISIRDQFDSAKQGYFSAIAMLAKRVQLAA